MENPRTNLARMSQARVLHPLAGRQPRPRHRTPRQDLQGLVRVGHLWLDSGPLGAVHLSRNICGPLSSCCWSRITFRMPGVRLRVSHSHSRYQSPSVSVSQSHSNLNSHSLTLSLSRSLTISFSLTLTHTHTHTLAFTLTHTLTLTLTPITTPTRTPTLSLTLPLTLLLHSLSYTLSHTLSHFLRLGSSTATSGLSRATHKHLRKFICPYEWPTVGS